MQTHKLGKLKVSEFVSLRGHGTQQPIGVEGFSINQVSHEGNQRQPQKIYGHNHRGIRQSQGLGHAKMSSQSAHHPQGVCNHRLSR
jgi:hypothetical protein